MPTLTPSTSQHQLSGELWSRWRIFEAELRASIPESTYSIWFQGIKPVALTKTTFRLGATDQTVSWLRSRFMPLLALCTKEAFGPELSIEVVSLSANKVDSDQHGSGANQSAAYCVSQPNPHHTFSNFVIGDCNHLAHTAALAVAETAGQTYNPLILDGSNGLGKTHLLHAIAHYVQAYNPDSKVVYTTAETFTSEFVSSLQQQQIGSFKSYYRGADVLLVDDLHDFENKQRTQEEFVGTISGLLESGRQVVLSTDRPLSQLGGLSERLRGRLDTGLTTTLLPPDRRTRLAILEKQVELDHIQIDDLAALEFLAARVDTNVRGLVGALIRVIAYASLTRRKITADLAANVVGSLYPQNASSGPPTIDLILETTATELRVPVADILGPSRTAPVVFSRHIAMYLARRLTNQSLPKIGRHFGDRDHATVLHASRKIAKQLDVDDHVSTVVQQLINKMGVMDAANTTAIHKFTPPATTLT